MKSAYSNSVSIKVLHPFKQHSASNLPIKFVSTHLINLSLSTFSRNLILVSSYLTQPISTSSHTH